MKTLKTLLALPYLAGLAAYYVVAVTFGWVETVDGIDIRVRNFTEEIEMKKFGYVMLGLGLIIFLIGAAFGLEWLGIKWKGFFGPKHEAVRREVFKQTRSYNEGKEQELLKLRLEYMRASEEDKAALASTIRHQFADYDENLIDSSELRSFLKQIKYGH